MFNHKDDRVQAHLQVRFLALDLWRTLKVDAIQRASALARDSWSRKRPASKAWSCTCAHAAPIITTELRMSVVTTPEPAPAELLAYIGLRLPKDTREISNFVPKITL